MAASVIFTTSGEEITPTAFFNSLQKFLKLACILFRTQRMRNKQDFIQIYQFENSHFLPAKITATAAHLLNVYIYPRSIPLK
jgi:hypothetical protein